MAAGNLATAPTEADLEGIRAMADTLCDLIVMARACGDQLGNDDRIAAECWRAMLAITAAGLDFQYLVWGAATRLGLTEYAIG